MKRCCVLFLFSFLLATTCLVPCLEARDAREEWLSALSPHDLYQLMTDRFREEKWREAISFGKLLAERYPASPFSKEALYYAGLSYYSLHDYQMANDSFTAYLKEEKSPKYFDQIMQYKFHIAEGFEEGSRRHLFGSERMPKWIAAFEDAISIYDEIISSLPRDELAAKSLFRKGSLLLKLEEYRDSVESFQTLIRRFPQHPLTAEAYLMVGKVYLTQCLKEFPDTDRLDLAEINLSKFQLHFPHDARLEEGKRMVLEIQECLARALYEVGKFYEKTKKQESALIYYKSIIKRYPASKSAKEAMDRLSQILPSSLDQGESQGVVEGKMVEEKMGMDHEEKAALSSS